MHNAYLKKTLPLYILQCGACSDSPQLRLKLFWILPYFKASKIKCYVGLNCEIILTAKFYQSTVPNCCFCIIEACRLCHHTACLSTFLYMEWLENVRASLSELMQEYYVTDELMSDVTSNVQCKLTRWTPHCLTSRRWIHWMRRISHRVYVVYQA